MSKTSIGDLKGFQVAVPVQLLAIGMTMTTTIVGEIGMATRRANNSRGNPDFVRFQRSSQSPTRAVAGSLHQPSPAEVEQALTQVRVGKTSADRAPDLLEDKRAHKTTRLEVSPNKGLTGPAAGPRTRTTQVLVGGAGNGPRLKSLPGIVAFAPQGAEVEVVALDHLPATAVAVATEMTIGHNQAGQQLRFRKGL